MDWNIVVTTTSTSIWELLPQETKDRFETILNTWNYNVLSIQNRDEFLDVYFKNYWDAEVWWGLYIPKRSCHNFSKFNLKQLRLICSASNSNVSVELF